MIGTDQVNQRVCFFMSSWERIQLPTPSVEVTGPYYSSIITYYGGVLRMHSSPSERWCMFSGCFLLLPLDAGTAIFGFKKIVFSDGFDWTRPCLLLLCLLAYYEEMRITAYRSYDLLIIVWSWYSWKWLLRNPSSKSSMLYSFSCWTFGADNAAPASNDMRKLKNECTVVPKFAIKSHRPNGDILSSLLTINSSLWGLRNSLSFRP
jgi:hypothetical protein